MNEVIILLGSNINPRENIKKCLFLLNEEICISTYSNIWITQSFGHDGPDFFNLAILVNTPLDAKTIKTTLIKKIENDLGRIRFKDKYAPRTIDIDIMVFNDEVIDPDIWNKVFMAVPIAELKPDLKNLKNNQSLEKVAQKLKSSQRAELFKHPADFFPN